MDKITVIVPCYNEEESLPLFYKKINEVSKKIKNVTFDLLFIDDGSNDNTLNVIKNFRKIDKRVRFISFSRNFKKEAANYAGIENAIGDYAVIIDADLQHNPDLIIEMYNILKNEDYDSVAVRRKNRVGEPKVRSFFAQKFYKIMNKLSGLKVVDGATDYRMMNKKMYKSILDMPEYNRFTKGIFSFIGFKTKWIEQENIERIAGKTTWSFWSLFLYSLEGITGFSTLPLALSSIIGIVFCIIAFIMTIFIIIKTLIFGDPVAGYPSMICVIFLVGGIQLFCLGIIGEYLSKTYLETKKRPIYIVRQTEKDYDKNEK